MNPIPDTESLLDPCPCGERPHFIAEGYPRSIRCCGNCVRTRVECRSCGHSTTTWPTKHSAVCAWNKYVRELKKVP